MQSKPKNSAQLGFYSTFAEQLNHNHPLFRLEKEINWSVFDNIIDQRLNKDVDFVSLKYISPLIEKYINNDKILIYEA